MSAAAPSRRTTSIPPPASICIASRGCLMRTLAACRWSGIGWSANIRTSPTPRSSTSPAAGLTSMNTATATTPANGSRSLNRCAAAPRLERHSRGRLAVQQRKPQSPIPRACGALRAHAQRRRAAPWYRARSDVSRTQPVAACAAHQAPHRRLRREDDPRLWRRQRAAIPAAEDHHRRASRGRRRGGILGCRRSALLPTGRFDGVVCTDVLEHCPEEDLAWILEEIFSYAARFVYLNVACFPARKTLPSGENAHITIREPDWWHALVAQCSLRHADLVWELSSAYLALAEKTFRGGPV